MLGVNHHRRSATSDQISSIDSKNVVSSQGLRVRHTLQKCRTLSQAASFGPAVSARQFERACTIWSCRRALVTSFSL